MSRSEGGRHIAKAGGRREIRQTLKAASARFPTPCHTEKNTAGLCLELVCRNGMQSFAQAEQTRCSVVEEREVGAQTQCQWNLGVFFRKSIGKGAAALAAQPNPIGFVPWARAGFGPTILTITNKLSRENGNPREEGLVNCTTAALLASGSVESAGLVTGHGGYASSLGSSGIRDAGLAHLVTEAGVCWRHKI